MEDVYTRLAKHLEDLVMGYPPNDALIDLLKDSFSPDERRWHWQFPTIYYRSGDL